MYVDPHLKSESGDNKSSCFKYANYLMKENSFFFSANREDISLEEGVKLIDSVSKGGLKKNEAKWYAPMYSLSENESRHLVKKLFNKEVFNYTDLSPIEKETYNKEVLKFARESQNQMAKNFNKSSLGINTGKDLFYIGVVENIRKYSGTDEEVKKGYVKSGDVKKGFNTHIHIIQSRKANNEKRSLISPLANAKKMNTKFGQVGFDRNNFFKKIETSFDNLFNYNREIHETLEFKKKSKIAITKENTVNHDNDYFLNELLENVSVFGKAFNQAKREQDNRLNGFFTKKQLAYWEKRISTLDYFKNLEKNNKVEFKRENEKDFIYFDKETNKEIYVSKEKNKWNTFGTKKGGGIINAIMAFENKGWKEAVLELKDYSDQKSLETKIQRERFKIKKELKRSRVQKSTIISVKDVLSSKLLDKIKSYKKLDNNIENIFHQIKIKTPQNTEYSVLGMRNIAGGYTTHNGKFQNIVGKQDLIFKEGKRNDTLLVFKNLEEYLDYISEHDNKLPLEDIIILNDVDFIENAENIINKKNYVKIQVVSDHSYIKKKLKINFNKIH